jgi:hypothetical protein
MGRMRATGYLPDRHDVSKDPRSSERFGASRDMPVPSEHNALGYFEGKADLYRQGEAEACVGFTLGEMIDAHLASNLVEAPRANGLEIWKYARLMQLLALGETVEQAPLKNEGVVPLAAAQGMAKFGVPSVDQVPLDFDRINEPPSLEEDEHASAFRVSGWHRILSEGPQRLADMRVAIASNCLVAVGAAIDQAFLEYEGGDAAPTDLANMVGRHMWPVGQYDSAGRFRGFNHWGPEWGEGGFVWLPPEFLLSEAVTDLIVVTGELALPPGGKGK